MVVIDGDDRWLMAMGDGWLWWLMVIIDGDGYDDGDELCSWNHNCNLTVKCWLIDNWLVHLSSISEQTIQL